MAADGLLMGLKMEFAGPASFLSGVFLEAWLAIVRIVDFGLQRNAQVEVISRVSSRVCFVAAAVLDAGNHPRGGVQSEYLPLHTSNPFLVLMLSASHSPA